MTKSRFAEREHISSLSSAVTGSLNLLEIYGSQPVDLVLHWATSL